MDLRDFVLKMPRSVRMRYVENMPTEEIAKLTGKNGHAVLSIIKRDAVRTVEAIKREGLDKEILERWRDVPRYLKEILRLAGKELYGNECINQETFDFVRKRVWFTNGGVRLSEIVKERGCSGKIDEISLAAVLLRLGFKLGNGGKIIGSDKELGRKERITAIIEESENGVAPEEIIEFFEKRGERITKNLISTSVYPLTKEGEYIYCGGKYVYVPKVMRKYGEKVKKAIRECFLTRGNKAVLHLFDVEKCLKRKGVHMDRGDLACVLSSLGDYAKIGNVHYMFIGKSDGSRKEKRDGRKTRNIIQIARGILRRSSSPLKGSEITDRINDFYGTKISPSTIPKMMKEIGAVNTKRGYIPLEKASGAAKRVARAAEEILERHPHAFLSAVSEKAKIDDVVLTASLLRNAGFRVYGSNETGILSKSGENVMEKTITEAGPDADVEAVAKELSKKVYGNPPKKKLYARIYAVKKRKETERNYK